MTNIEIYTHMDCPFCQRAKALLRIKGVPFVEYIISDAPHLQKDMAQRSGGRTDVPQTFINGHHIGNCQQLFDLEENGQLDSWLQSPMNGQD